MIKKSSQELLDNNKSKKESINIDTDNTNIPNSEIVKKSSFSEYKKNRYHSDPEFRKKVIENTKRYISKRYNDDSVFRDKIKQNSKNWYYAHKYITKEKSININNINQKNNK
jgi:hypothetical protein